MVIESDCFKDFILIVLNISFTLLIDFRQAPHKVFSVVSDLDLAEFKNWSWIKQTCYI